MTDFRALCAELLDALDSGIPSAGIRNSLLADRARAALAETEPDRLSDENLMKMWGLPLGARAYEDDVINFANAVLAASQPQATKPPSLKERGREALQLAVVMETGGRELDVLKEIVESLPD